MKIKTYIHSFIEYLRKKKKYFCFKRKKENLCFLSEYTLDEQQQQKKKEKKKKCLIPIIHRTKEKINK